MTGEAPTRPAGERRLSPRTTRVPAIAMAAVGLIAVAVAVVLFVVRDDAAIERNVLTGPTGDRFTLVYPDGWFKVAEKGRGGVNPPLAALRRRAGKASLLVHRQGPLKRGFDKLAGDLDRQLRRRFSDFERRSAKTVLVGSREGYLYVFVRRSAGTVHSIVIVPANDRSYTMNSIARVGDQRAGEEIAAMLRSFRPPG